MQDAGPGQPPRFHHGIETALSGGGFRASAYALGALIYLVQSGLNRNVDCVASVSGGSITNAYVAGQCDFKAIDLEEFKQVARRLAMMIARDGLIGRRFLFSLAYLIIMSLWTVGIAVLMVRVRHWTGANAVVLIVLVVAWLWAALGRGMVVSAWLRNLLRACPAKFGDMPARAADHVLCATDLCSSGPFFFSTKGAGRLFNRSYGRGDGRDVRLYQAVRASAAFPPFIPRMRFRLSGRNFAKDVPQTIYLSDGGVWNNVATDWSRLRAEVRSEEIRWIQAYEGAGSFVDALRIGGDRSLPDNPGRILIVIDASAPPLFSPLKPARWPLLALLTTAKRSIDVSYNSTLAARMADIVYTAKMRMMNDPPTWELNLPKPPGQEDVWGEQLPLELAVPITKTPGQLAQEWAAIGELSQWADAKERCEHDFGTPEMQELVALMTCENSSIPTTLNSLGRERTLSLIVHGYLGVREMLASALANYVPEPPLPKQWFEDLIVR